MRRLMTLILACIPTATLVEDAEAAPPANPASTMPADVIVGWRGDGTGVYSNVNCPTNWDDAKTIRWRVRVGHAFSSPVIADDSVLVTAEPSDIVCVDLRDGALRWKASLKAADVPTELALRVAGHASNATSCGFAAATPVCNGREAFVVFGSGLTACYSLDGKRKWVQYLEPAAETYGHSSSPLLIDRMLLVNVNHLTALDADSGKIVWECTEAEHTYGTPIAMSLGALTIVVTPLGTIIRVSDGRVLAKDIAPELGGLEFGISPVAAGDVVYLGDNTITATRIVRDGDSVRAQELWSANPEVTSYASPVAWNGMLFFVGKSAECFVLDLKTGAKLYEQELKIGHSGVDDPELSSANMYPSLIIANGKLLVANDQGQTFVYEASKEMKEIARNRLTGGSGATAALVGSSIILRGGNFLYCIGK